MTTTPAPTDLDALVDVAARAIQAYQARTAFPPEQYTWDAIPQEWRDRHLAAARVMVDAAMTQVLDELAKTRAELDATHAELERLRGVIREGVDMAEWHRNEITTWKRKSAKLRAELANAKARISAAATVEVWTNEDGKRFVFADDLMRALDPNPEANPATTAEPADEDELVPHVEHVSAETIAGMAAMGEIRNPEIFAPWDDEPKATCHLPVQNGEPCGLLICRKHGCRVAPTAETAAS